MKDLYSMIFPEFAILSLLFFCTLISGLVRDEHTSGKRKGIERIY